MTHFDFLKMKQKGEKISMVTCYDYTSARMVAASRINCVLVGDSCAMTMHGHPTTIDATTDLMALHIRAVQRGAADKFLIGDMPFLAHRGSLDRTMDSVHTLMKAGAHAIKIEGVDGSESTISHIVESGIPVMGHIGLTPQSIHKLGGYKVQGTEPETREILLAQAHRLERCGVFALVLECVPATVAADITEQLKIPTIGIGAGVNCSGQVLVIQDLWGLNTEFKPRFVRQYIDGHTLLTEALDRFDSDVKSTEFPSNQESY